MKPTIVAVTRSRGCSRDVMRSKRQRPSDALDGVDTVVLLKQGKEVFGKSAFRSERGRFTYLFSSAETKAEFDKAPEKYAIQMGGLCARMGRTVTGNPSDYLVHDGKIYIFGSDACHKLFASAPEKYLPKPAAPMPRDTAAATRGRALLDKAARQLAAPKLDTMASYVEMTSETQKRPTGDVQIATRKTWRFPAGARQRTDDDVPDGQKVVFGTLLTPGGAWRIGGHRRHRSSRRRSRPCSWISAGRSCRCCAPGERAGDEGGGARRRQRSMAWRSSACACAGRPRRDAEPRRQHRRVHSTSFIDRGARRTVRRVHARVLRLPARRWRHGPLRGEGAVQRAVASRCRASSIRSASTAPLDAGAVQGPRWT